VTDITGDSFMKIRSIAFAAGVLSLTAALAVTPARAQVTATDSFEITVSNPVTIGHKTLQPGDYTVEPLNIAGGDAPVLLIRGKNDARVRLAAKVIPTVENRTQPETRVLFHHIGDRYYFDRIWVKGAAYGYKFELPKNVKSDGQEQ
jgi:hypothetical protein